MKWLVSLLTVFLLSACAGDAGGDTSMLFEQLPAAKTGIDFENRVTNDSELNIFNYRNFYNGGGVGIGDLNNDGLPDIFLTANMGPNKLYLNRGDWAFEDVSVTAGIEQAQNWSTGVALVDLNQDGWLDIYVCNAGFRPGGDQRNSLFLNNRDGTFREAAAEYGLDDSGYSTHAAFLDYDNDGDLDAYILNNSFIPVNSLNLSDNRELYAEDWKVKDFLRGGGDKLLRNDGGKFTDVSQEAGIYGSLIGFGLGVTVGDVNGDYYPDIYVSNDFYERDYLYINQQDGTFLEEVERQMGHLSLASMGADLADLNNDRYPELFATEMLPETDFRRKTTVQFENLNTYLLKQKRGFYHQYMHNTLQANNGDGTFSEVAQYAGVEATDWSWGALLFDADNDGLRDILVCNGIYHNLTSQDFIDFFDSEVQRMALTGKKDEIDKVINAMPSEPLPNKLYRNLGDFRFADKSEEWGMGTPTFSNGAAYGDLDGDGDLDLVVSNVNQPVSIFRNHAESTENHHLTVKLTGPDSNPFAVGAAVELFRGDEVLSTQIIPTRGFQSSVDYPAVFGLGDNPTVDSLRVIWPDRTVSLLQPGAVDTLLTVNYSPDQPRLENFAPARRRQTSPGLFTAVDFGLEPHREDDYQDQINEGLLMRSLTREGPGTVSGDLDGDGLDDLIVAGARNQPTRVYLQRGDSLAATDQPVFRQLSVTETTGLTLFDADGDGDADLFLASGGNFDKPGSPYFQDLLLFNDGTGQFLIQKGSLPRTGVNTAVGVALDYDGDGDLDLFAGSRSVPGSYGNPPPSYLYENDGSGKFRDVTETVAPELLRLGMVTDAVWTATDGGTLAITREWGSVALFRYADGQLTEVVTNLSDHPGWWYAVRAADLDGDGDEDLVLGNRGENFYFSGDNERPAKLFMADFDGNGTVDKVFTQSVDGRDMPLFMKRDLTAQLPGLKKASLKHEDYAKKSVTELFGAAAVGKARVLEATEFRSVIAINQGDGRYELRPLPAAVQFSSVNAIAVRDLNGDDRPDLLLGGNFSGYLPQFSRQDASYGQVLLNRGDATFDLLMSRESGLQLRGDVKGFTSLTVGGTAYLIATINDAAPLAFRLAPTTE